MGKHKQDTDGQADMNGFLFSEEAVSFLPREMRMMEFDVEPLVLKSRRAKWRDEIERAVANVKRSGEDKRSRREFYRAGAWRGWGRRQWRDPDVGELDIRRVTGYP